MKRAYMSSNNIHCNAFSKLTFLNKTNFSTQFKALSMLNLYPTFINTAVNTHAYTTARSFNATGESSPEAIIKGPVSTSCKLLNTTVDTS
jgi:hypothetical protein